MPVVGVGCVVGMEHHESFGSGMLLGCGGITCVVFLRLTLRAGEFFVWVCLCVWVGCLLTV